VKVELSLADVEAMVGPDLRRELSARLDEVRLVSTETAADLLEVSINTFKAVARLSLVEPVKLGPRVIRWRLEDVKKLGNPETLK